MDNLSLILIFSVATFVAAMCCLVAITSRKPSSPKHAKQDVSNDVDTQDNADNVDTVQNAVKLVQDVTIPTLGSIKPKERGGDTAFVYLLIAPDGKFTVRAATGDEAVSKYNNLLRSNSVPLGKFDKYIKKNKFSRKQVRQEIVKQDFKDKDECYQFKDNLISEVLDNPNYVGTAHTSTTRYSARCKKQDSKIGKDTKTPVKPEEPEDRGDKTAIVYKVFTPDDKFTVKVATGKCGVSDYSKSTTSYDRLYLLGKYAQEQGFTCDQLRKEIIKQDFATRTECYKFKDELLERVKDDPNYIGNGKHIIAQTQPSKKAMKKPTRFTPVLPISPQPIPRGKKTAIVYKMWLIPSKRYTIGCVTGGQAINNLKNNCVRTQAIQDAMEEDGSISVKCEIIRQDFDSRTECFEYKNKLLAQAKKDPKFINPYADKGQGSPNYGKDDVDTGVSLDTKVEVKPPISQDIPKSNITITQSPVDSSTPIDRGDDTAIVYRASIPSREYVFSHLTGKNAANNFKCIRLSDLSSPLYKRAREKGYADSDVEKIIIRQDFNSIEECFAYKDKLIEKSQKDPLYVGPLPVGKTKPTRRKKVRLPKPTKPMTSKQKKCKIYCATFPDGKYYIGVTYGTLKSAKIGSRSKIAYQYMKEHGYTNKDLKKKFLHQANDKTKFKTYDDFLEQKEALFRSCAVDPKCLNAIDVCPECGSINKHKKSCSKYNRKERTR